MLTLKTHAVFITNKPSSVKWALHLYRNAVFDTDPSPEGNMRLTISSAREIRHSDGDTGTLRHEQVRYGDYSFKIRQISVEQIIFKYYQ